MLIWGALLVLLSLQQLGWKFAAFGALSGLLALTIAGLLAHYADNIKTEIIYEMIANGYLSMCVFKNSELITTEIELGKKALEGDFDAIVDFLETRATSFQLFSKLPLDINLHLVKLAIMASHNHEKFFSFQNNAFEEWARLPHENETIH